MTIECKWSAGAFDARNLLAFRRQYPKGINFVMAPNVDQAYVHRFRTVSVQFVSLPELIDSLKRSNNVKRGN